MAHIEASPSTAPLHGQLARQVCDPLQKPIYVYVYLQSGGGKGQLWQLTHPMMVWWPYMSTSLQDPNVSRCLACTYVQLLNLALHCHLDACSLLHDDKRLLPIYIPHLNLYGVKGPARVPSDLTSFERMAQLPPPLPPPPQALNETQPLNETRAPIEESVGGVTSSDVRMEGNPAYQPLPLAAETLATTEPAQPD